MSKYCTSIYLCLLMFLFPLYYQNNYINILEAKTTMFVTGTIIYILGILICYWIESIKAYEAEIKNAKKSRKRKKKPAEKLTVKNEGKDWQTIFLLAFVLILILTTIVSGDIGNAWHAANTKSFGTKILLLCAGIYIFTAKGFVPGKALRGCLIVGTTIVFGLAVLNRFNIDPLQMYSNLIEEQWPIYLSTIGNANILSNYVCVFLPLIMGLFLYVCELPAKIIYGMLTVLGVMAGISTNSDSFFLGFGAGLFVFLWFSLTSKEKTQEYLKLCILCAAAMVVLKVLTVVSTFDVPWESIQKTLIDDVPWLAALICFSLLWYIVGKMDLSASRCHKIRITLFSILAIVTTVFVIYVIKVNIWGGEDSNAYLIFDDKWGTNRGYVWKHTWLLFGELPWYQKLIGIGPGGFYDFFTEANEIRIKPFVDPHSDYLFYLVSTGILGFVSYFGIIISAIAACVRKKQPQTIILMAVLIAWLAQATVNTSLVFTAPYLFVTLGLVRWYGR